VLYCLSGAAALLYEVVWLRLLTLSMDTRRAPSAPCLPHSWEGWRQARGWLADLPHDHDHANGPCKLDAAIELIYRRIARFLLPIGLWLFGPFWLGVCKRRRGGFVRNRGAWA
jgi:hypothetical protein